ncbi:hypothetical protein BB560_001977 [Smittium megazygosporum]|uniref:Uncharacterized protein n=1 Tax=Smittium megazygosporum TaxID=133381 RepID=A0A2T9ZG46_9FUNG|nr:hypothetical protein BB560_001977 [Smittium megazygosporum]
MAEGTNTGSVVAADNVAPAIVEPAAEAVKSYAEVAKSQENLIEAVSKEAEKETKSTEQTHEKDEQKAEKAEEKTEEPADTKEHKELEAEHKETKASEGSDVAEKRSGEMKSEAKEAEVDEQGTSSGVRRVKKEHDKAKRASLLQKIKLPKSFQAFSSSMFHPKRPTDGSDKTTEKAGADNKKSAEMEGQGLAENTKEEPKAEVTDKEVVDQEAKIVPETFGSDKLDLKLDEQELKKESVSDLKEEKKADAEAVEEEKMPEKAAEKTENAEASAAAEVPEKPEARKVSNTSAGAGSTTADESGDDHQQAAEDSQNTNITDTSVEDEEQNKKVNGKTDEQTKKKGWSFGNFQKQMVNKRTSVISSISGLYEKIVTSTQSSTTKKSKKTKKSDKSETKSGDEGEKNETESTGGALDEVQINSDPLTIPTQESSKGAEKEAEKAVENANATEKKNFDVSFNEFDVKLEPESVH